MRRAPSSAAGHVLIVVCALVFWATCCSPALARQNSKPPRTLHLKFQTLGSAGHVWTGQEYAFLGSARLSR